MKRLVITIITCKDGGGQLCHLGKRKVKGGWGNGIVSYPYMLFHYKMTVSNNKKLKIPFKFSKPEVVIGFAFDFPN